MKILYDFRIFSLQRFGGVSRYFFELIKSLSELSRNDTEIYLFEGLHINEYKTLSLQKNLTNYCGLKRPYINKTLNIFYQLNKLVFKIYRSSKHFKYHETIYHPTYYAEDITDFRNKYKIIITVYDMIHEKFPEYFPRIETELFKKKKSIENADGIICISDNTKKDLIDYYKIDPDKVNVIYPGPNLIPDNIQPNKFNNKKPFILFVGKRLNYKNFSLLLDSYIEEKLFHNFDLLCFGGETQSSSESNKIKKHGLEKNIRLLKGDDTLLISLYKGASCLVYPSLYEGFGMPILEAIMQGCPVITADSSSLPEVGRDAAIYFKPGNLLDLSSKLNKVLNDENLRSIMIKKGYRQANNFSWKKNAEKTLRLYKKCLTQ